MNESYLLYHSLLGEENNSAAIHKALESYPGAIRHDMVKIDDYPAFLCALDENDKIIICGNDKTLSLFMNAVKGVKVRNDVYYCVAGCESDFLNDLGRSVDAAPTYKINRYIKDLPAVVINGEECYFINGVCCGIEDNSKSLGASIRNNKPCDVTVTVDGEIFSYRKVWLAAVMNGRYSDGRKYAPEQCRHHKEKSLSLVVLHGGNKLKLLCGLPAVSKGKHMKRKDMVDILRGKDITVELDSPRTVRTDRAAIGNVLSLYY